MALKRNFQSLDTFSMSSMTDVIFLLLIFFMVTSTIIFPAAIDVNLPQSSEQSSEKPVTEVYIDSDNSLWLVADRSDSTQRLSSPRQLAAEELAAELVAIHQADSLRGIALYADSTVAYARVISILDMAARNNIRIVLATKASANPPATGSSSQAPQ